MSSLRSPFLAKRDQRNAVQFDEPLHIGDESLADQLHQRRRRKRVTPMKSEEIHHALVILQPRLIHAEIHPIDTLDFQSVMFIEDIGHAAG